MNMAAELLNLGSMPKNGFVDILQILQIPIKPFLLWQSLDPLAWDRTHRQIFLGYPYYDNRNKSVHLKSLDKIMNWRA